MYFSIIPNLKKKSPYTPQMHKLAKRTKTAINIPRSQ